MSLPLLVVRPEPGNAATVHAAREAGLHAERFPLFAAESRAWACPDPAMFEGLVVTSANAVRHAGPQLARLRSLPVHAVGEATAAAARAAGLRVATTGDRGIQALLPLFPSPSRLLRLTGEEYVALPAPPELTIETHVVYAMRPHPLPDALADRLRGPSVVLLHSAAAARHFAAECDRRRLSRAPIALACLAPRVAEAAGQGWSTLAAAAAPSDAALLALAGRMCQTGALGVTDDSSDG